MSDQPSRTYLIFERQTGRILGSSSVYDASSSKYVEQSAEEILSLFSLPEGLTKADIDVLEAQLPGEAYQGGYRVDSKPRKLMTKLKLQLQAARTEVEGDGQDSVEIDIQVLDEHGKIVQDFEGELKVTTTHGRLSARGGRIEVSRGRAQITLTSTNESIEQVWVSVRDLEDRSIPDGIGIEFL